MKSQWAGVKYRIKKLHTENLLTTDVIKDKIAYIQNIALPLDWKISAFYNRSGKLTLEKDDVKMVIDLNKNNVVTTMQHYKFPKPTKLKRSNLELFEIASILYNPRVHTSKGSYIQHKRKAFWSQ